MASLADIQFQTIIDIQKLSVSKGKKVLKEPSFFRYSDTSLYSPIFTKVPWNQLPTSTSL